mgnify:CR=1 FL=1|jgi:dipeptidase
MINEQPHPIEDKHSLFLLQLRAERNKRLSATDYLATSDRTLEQHVADYRQALRDLPQRYEGTSEQDYGNIEFPIYNGE